MTKALDIPSTSINLDDLFTEPVIVEVSGPKLVTILPLRDWHSKIGGVWYYCYKGKTQKVPDFVAEVFKRDPTKLG
jgi:hypothetical protein